MRFKVDENLTSEVVRRLVEAGHDALSVHDQQMVGVPDSELARVCRAEGRCLVTLDLGFADLRAYSPSIDWSIIVFRPRDQSRRALNSLTERFIAEIELRRPTNALWIVSDAGVRVRSNRD